MDECEPVRPHSDQRIINTVDGEPVDEEGGNGAEGSQHVQEGDVIESGEHEEECEMRKALPTPIAPTPSEIEDHRVDHLPYRPWCDHCVEGQGRERGHFSVDQSKRGLSTLSMDYLFVTSTGVFTRAEFEGETEGEAGEVDIEALLRPLYQEPCLVKTKDWWTYEVS